MHFRPQLSMDGFTAWTIWLSITLLVDGTEAQLGDIGGFPGWLLAARIGVLDGTIDGATDTPCEATSHS